MAFSFVPKVTAWVSPSRANFSFLQKPANCAFSFLQKLLLAFLLITHFPLCVFFHTLGKVFLLHPKLASWRPQVRGVQQGAGGQLGKGYLKPHTAATCRGPYMHTQTGRLNSHGRAGHKQQGGPPPWTRSPRRERLPASAGTGSCPPCAGCFAGSLPGT
jgi:hypothetical protein